MKGALIAGLIVIAALAGATVLTVYRRADLTYRVAHDACLSAGGAWVARSPRSFSGTCLRTRVPEPVGLTSKRGFSVSL